MSKKPKPEGYVFGRPATYRPEFCEKLIKHMAEGYSFSTFVSIVMCHPKYLYEWVDKYQDFADAKKIGEDLSRQYWEKLGKDNMITTSKQYGKGVGESRALNSSAWIFTMKNKFGWRDNVAVEVSGKEDGPAIVIAYSKEELENLKAKKK